MKLFELVKSIKSYTSDITKYKESIKSDEMKLEDQIMKENVDYRILCKYIKNIESDSSIQNKSMLLVKLNQIKTDSRRNIISKCRSGEQLNAHQSQ